jgi:hypothetical protein
MRTTTLCLFLYLTLAFALDSYAQATRSIKPLDKQNFEKQTRVAIIVAVGRYEGLSPLKYTLADAQDLAAELQRQGYDVHKLVNNEATSDSIRRKFAEVNGLIDPKQGTVLFFFTGHGFQNAQGHNYLATYAVNMANLDQEGLPVSEVEKLLKETGAVRKMLWLDACRNVPDQKAVATPRSFARVEHGEGVGILYSTRAGAFSYEDSTLQHGVFSYFLLEGLQGKAAGQDGLVTFLDLASYVETNVYSHAKAKDWIQKPFKAGEFTGDFLVATAAPPKPEERQQQSAKTQVAGDALVMRREENNESFFAEMRADSILLYRGKDMTSYAVLNKVEDTKAGGLYRTRIAGGQDLELVAQDVTGGEVKMLVGRIGVPCPPNDPCTGPEVRLPHEGASKTAAAMTGSRATRAGVRIAGGWLNRGDAARVLTQIDQSTTRVEQNLTTTVRQTHRWQPFTLATSIRKPQ